jgi:hypothetical protein
MMQYCFDGISPEATRILRSKLTTRRVFLRQAGVGLAGAALAGAMSTGRAMAADGGRRKQSIEQVQQTYSDDIMKLKGVVGHGSGSKGREKVLVIYVQDTAAKEYVTALLADRIAGYPVRIEVTGEIRAQ